MSGGPNSSFGGNPGSAVSAIDPALAAAVASGVGWLNSGFGRAGILPTDRFEDFGSQRGYFEYGARVVRCVDSLSDSQLIDALSGGFRPDQIRAVAASEMSFDQVRHHLLSGVSAARRSVGAASEAWEDAVLGAAKGVGLAKAGQYRQDLLSMMQLLRFQNPVSWFPDASKRLEATLGPATRPKTRRIVALQNQWTSTAYLGELALIAQMASADGNTELYSRVSSMVLDESAEVLRRSETLGRMLDASTKASLFLASAVSGLVIDGFRPPDQRRPDYVRARDLLSACKSNAVHPSLVRVPLPAMATTRHRMVELADQLGLQIDTPGVATGQSHGLQPGASAIQMGAPMSLEVLMLEAIGDEATPEVDRDLLASQLPTVSSGKQGSVLDLAGPASQNSNSQAGPLMDLMNSRLTARSTSL